MLNDERRDEIIIALADALAEISQCYVNYQRIEDCTRRFDAERPRGRLDAFALAAWDMKFLAHESASNVQHVRRLADQALREHTEPIAQVRLSYHWRRGIGSTAPPSSPPGA